MLDEIPSAALTEWQAFAELEPFGARIEDYRAGMLAATIANTSIRPKKPFLPSDFMPDRSHLEAQAPAKVTGAEVLSLFRALGATEAQA